MSLGVIYILTNPSFKEYVKIGYADDLDARLKQLNNTECTPFAFRVYATYEVEHRLTDINVHRLIDKLNPSLRSIDTVEGKKRVREFYAMSPEDAYEILETIAEISNTSSKLKKIAPSVAEKEAEKTAEEIKIKSEFTTKERRKEYWEAFNTYAETQETFKKEFKSRKPSTDHWMSLSVGLSKVAINLLQERNRDTIGVELSINDASKEQYKVLERHKESIEAEVGASFNWMELPNKIMSRVVIEKEVDFMDEEEWNSQFDWLIKTAARLKNATIGYLKKK